MGPFKLRLLNGRRAVAPLTNLWALGQPLGPLDPVIPGLPLESTAGALSITPAHGAIVLTGLAPTVSASANPAPALAALTLSGQAPTVAVSLNAQPAAAALTLRRQ